MNFSGQWVDSLGKRTHLRLAIWNVWKGQIRSLRKIPTALMKEHSTKLRDESLWTLMTETEAIISSRPLTVVDPLSDTSKSAFSVQLSC